MDINNISHWSRNTKLLFNEAKFIHLHFWPKATTIPHTYTVNGKSILQKSTHKDLGIIFTSNLQWSEHYKSITAKAYLTLGEMMRKIFLNNELYSDVTFVVNGKRIPAHRCVLTTHSEVLSAMFSRQFTESRMTEVRSHDVGYPFSYVILARTLQVELPGVDFDAFIGFLQYLYTDDCPVKEYDEVMKILVLADRYCVNRLKALCELHIKEMVEKAIKVPVHDLQVNVIGKCTVSV